MRFIPSLAVLIPVWTSLAPLQAQENIASLPEVPFAQLSDRSLGPLGQAALAIRPNDWKHAETKNFVYHFFHGFLATPVSVEAEFFYNFLARELGKDTTQWERKCHIFIFESDAEWAEFKKKGALDPWTGGLHAGGELFIQRNPELKWKGNALGHEVTHLVVHRFFGNGVPLWLHEGYAENAASRGYAAFYRARGYDAKPRSRPLEPARLIPLADLTAQAAYPGDETMVRTFYAQSERLTRFLSSTDAQGFNRFFEALSQGNRIESALAKGYQGRFSSLEVLEREFKADLQKDSGPGAAP